MNKPRKNYQEALVEQRVNWRKSFLGAIPSLIFGGLVAYCFVYLIDFFEEQLVNEMRAMDEFRKQEASGIMAGLIEVQKAINALEQTIRTQKPTSTEINAAKINAEVTEPDPELDLVPCCGDPTLFEDKNFMETIPDGATFQEIFDQMMGSMMQGKQAEQFKQAMQELDAFANSLNEEQLAELERRTEEATKEMMEIFANPTLFALAGEQQPPPQDMKRVVDGLRESARLSALMDMHVESDVLALEEEAISEIERVPLTEEEQRELENQWKMQETLRILEEAAREQQ